MIIFNVAFLLIHILSVAHLIWLQILSLQPNFIETLKVIPLILSSLTIKCNIKMKTKEK